jgi:hypothetical protein
MKPHPGFGIGVNNYPNHYVTVADAKAAGIFTADFAFRGYLMINVPMASWSLVSHWVILFILMISGIMPLHTIYPSNSTPIS